VGIGDHTPSSLGNVESFRVYLLMVAGRMGVGRWETKKGRILLHAGKVGTAATARSRGMSAAARIYDDDEDALGFFNEVVFLPV
jgi:hypothetical protein